MLDVVGIGLNAIDYLVRVPRFPVPGEKLRMSAFAREGGGQVATALVALSRWGRRCKYVGNVGDDEHGRLSSLLLSREGVDRSHLRTVPGASSQFAVILVEEETGERTILWDRDPRIRVSPEDLPLDDIRRARALLLDGHDVLPAIAAAKAARAAGVPVVLDAEKVQEGTEELLSLCDHIVAAGHFPGMLLHGASAEDGAREILRRYAPRTSTVTLGPRGAFGCDGREEIFSPSIPVEAMDTTGAGDIFHAGFLYALLEGLPFREILAFANTAAGLSCRGMGGRAAIPTIEAIRAAGASPGRLERGGLMACTSTPEGTETIRHQIRTLLEAGPLTAKEISSAVRRPEKEIANHLEHLKKSLHSEGRRLSQVPAECRGCGFVFRKRERLKAPSRCPVCKGEAISDPAFRVEDK